MRIDYFILLFMSIDFSATSSIYRIMLEYLQPFELACITGDHTEITYFNAAACSSEEYLIKHKRPNYSIEGALEVAAEAGQINSVLTLIVLGAKDYPSALYTAASNGHLDIIRVLAPKVNINKLNVALIVLANMDQPESIRLLVELGADYVGIALTEAAYRGNIKNIQLFIELGATNLENAITTAVTNKHHEAVQLLYKYSSGKN